MEEKYKSNIDAPLYGASIETPKCLYCKYYDGPGDYFITFYKCKKFGKAPQKFKGELHHNCSEYEFDTEEYFKYGIKDPKV